MDLLRLALKTSMIFHSDRIDSVGPRVCGSVHRFHLARDGGVHSISGRWKAGLARGIKRGLEFTLIYESAE